MPGFFAAMKRLFTYNGQSDMEGFELLETKYEKVPGEEKEGRHEQQETKTDNKETNIKTPVTFENWNKTKKEEKKTQAQRQNAKVDSDLQINMAIIITELGIPVNTDIITRKFKIGHKIDAFIIYFEGMADKQTINGDVLKPLMNSNNFTEYFKSGEPEDITDYITNNVITANEAGEKDDFDIILYDVLSGDTALFIAGCNKSIVINTIGYEKRQVDKPITENVVRGSQEGFTESLRTNVSQIRRIIRNKNLITEMVKVGKLNKIYCAIMYIDGITNPELIKEVKRRVNKIDIDYVASTGMLEQLIEDNTWMPFPQMVSTERPDRAASFLVEGQVVIISEGAPFAIAAPATFFRLFHTSEDANLRWQYGTFIRFIRGAGIVLATILPSMYIALVLYHKEMIPTPMLVSIASGTENVPFPAVVELLLMEFSFELIREGGIRVPGVIGQTLGIVGALILGQAAVQANLVSPILIIVVAVAGLGSFAIPNYSLSVGLRMLRFFFTVFGAIAGFFGVAAGFTIAGTIACAMKSFGVPFFSPIAPKTGVNPDVIIRQPIWKQNMRADYLNTPDRTRSGKNPRRWKKKPKGGGKG